MYILQISDFHLGEENGNTFHYESILRSLIQTVNEIVPHNKDEKESIAIIVCGDIVRFNKETEKSEIEGYQYAETFLNQIKDELSKNFDLTFGFVPGNHDRVVDSFANFYKFTRKFNSCWESSSKTCCHMEICDLNFVFVNSALAIPEEKSRGKINYDELEALLSEIKNHHPIILVLHHTLMSMEDGDGSSILNAARMMKLIEEHNVMLVLHGHLHAFTSVAVGSGYCSVLGAGALFIRNYPNVNSQFNLIHLNADTIVSIDNYRFQADPSNQGFYKVPIEHKRGKRSNYFTGPKMSDAYNRLVSALKHNGVLYNISIGGIFEYSDFKSDIKHTFGDIDELGFTYTELAEMWQSECIPSEQLYFSHGGFYKKNDAEKSGIDYIKDALRANKTTSKAVLSSFNMKNVYDAIAEEDDFLPSLMIIQFGFEDSNSNTLRVTSYLRALDASRFLKINICEILYLTEKLKRARIASVSNFTKIELVINAFRTQLISNFSCFMKPEIDRLSNGDIQLIVTQNEHKKIAQLLEEKSIYTHTVDAASGIKYLLNRIKWFKREHPSLSVRYSEEMIEAIWSVELKLDELKMVKKTTSLHSDDDIKAIQNEYVEAIGHAVSVFRGDSV